MKLLADWSPIGLKRLYGNEVYKSAHNKFTDGQKEVKVQKIEALYRLGTQDEMKEVKQC